jgi:hypothetical protein
MKAQRQPLSAGCREVPLSVLGSLAHQQGVVRPSGPSSLPMSYTTYRRPLFSRPPVSLGQRQDPALAGGCSARASGFGSPRRPVTRSAVTYGQPVTRQWNLRSIRQPSPRTTRSRRGRSRLAGRAAVGAGEAAVSTTATSCVILPASAPSSRDSTLPYAVIVRRGVAGVYVRIPAANMIE